MDGWMDSNHDKNGGTESCDTLPKFIFSSPQYGKCYTSVQCTYSVLYSVHTVYIHCPFRLQLSHFKKQLRLVTIFKSGQPPTVLS